MTGNMTNKEKYNKFCEKNYVPLYSKPWWLDAVCEPENWDVWIMESNGTICAAMPYYLENRNGRMYITKAPLTQNNGLIFNYSANAKPVAKSIFEERVIDEACAFIKNMKLDVYEQQYQTSFLNCLPFLWNDYNAIVRYTYVIDDTSDLDGIWNNITSKKRSTIKKGQNKSVFNDDKLDIDSFYKEHEKIYTKQGLSCPFSFEMWNRIARSCFEHGCGKISCRVTETDEIAALSFVAWDEKRLYKLMGGPVPEFSHLDAYSALTWDEIKYAHDLGVAYDFEGSVIKRISKSFREYGAKPMPYFRIRKVFNPDIVLEEAENHIKKLEKA